VIFEPAAETIDPGERRDLQSERLNDLVRYVWDRVPFYQQRLEQAGINPDKKLTVDDLPRLPLTKKTTLRDTYPLGMLAVPKDQVARVHASSGTTGKPTVVAYTKEDLGLFAHVVARSLAMGGAQPGMVHHNAYGYGLFTGGLGIHYGGELLGMTVVPVSGGMTERQITLIRDLQPEIITCTPSYALNLAQELASQGIAASSISLQFAVLGAEPWTESMRREIDVGLGVRSTNIYGLSEIIGPGVANECVEVREGSHINEDHFLAEIVDRETGEVLDDGKEGVLVLTTLTKKAFPMVRYWTGDITSLSRGRCACGRTLVKMAPVKARADDMLIIRGVNVFPGQVGDVLVRIPELSANFQLVATREGAFDKLEVRVELTDKAFRSITAEVLSDAVVEADHTLRSLRQRAVSMLRETIGISISVSLVAPGDIPRSETGKLRRVEDHRQPL
jgi:phenylacetate-CoA ligase